MILSIVVCTKKLDVFALKTIISLRPFVESTECEVVIVCHEHSGVYDDELEKCIVLKDPGIGVYHAMNLGCDRATGEFLWFINTADSFVGNAESLIANLISSRSEVEIFAIGYALKFEKSFHSLVVVGEKTKSFIDRLSHQNLIYKKNLHLVYGRYSENFNVISDRIFLDHVLNYCKVQKLYDLSLVILIDFTTQSISFKPLLLLQDSLQAFFEKRFRFFFRCGFRSIQMFLVQFISLLSFQRFDVLYFRFICKKYNLSLIKRDF